MSSEHIKPNSNQTWYNENKSGFDEGTDDCVEASFNFALRQASGAAIWNRQKTFENLGQLQGRTGSSNQPFFHTVAPENIENSSGLKSRFEQVASSGFKERKNKNLAPNHEEDDIVIPARKATRRKSETLDPSSSRAKYLEKNRQAASRCRRNQKKKTESLVEKARAMEEKNRILKVEVACLKDDMASLMDVVASHGRCPDNRLRTYVQREADRLVDGQRTSIGELASGSIPSPSSSDSYGVTFGL